MRILITNFDLAFPAGSEWFVVDLARGLRRRGHEPAVYAPVLGEMAGVLRDEGIAVVDDLANLEAPPDVLHLQHRIEALTALARYPGVPAIHVCHGLRPWQESPIRHPAVVRHVAIDEVTRERIEREAGLDGGEIVIVPNAVDLGRFRRRGALPERPRRALALHHRLRVDNGGTELGAACAAAGIELEIAGSGSGHPWPRPEERLGEFDLLFGHGRVALEGLVSGLAVIVFGPEGLGPYVEPGNFVELRRRNFGFRTQSEPISTRGIGERIAAYDVRKSAAVTDLALAEADLERALDAWIGIYRDAAATPVAREAMLGEGGASALSRDLRRLSLDLRELDRAAGLAFQDRRLRDDAAERRMEALEQFREAVLRSRSFRWTERLRRLAGRGWIDGAAAKNGSGKRLLALLVFRDEMEFLPGWFENVAPEVDGVVALDDGSIDGSREFVAGQRSVLEVVRLPRRDEALWDDGSNHRRVIEAALRHRPDWLLGVDADERLERGFGARARQAIADGERAGVDAFFVGIRELWGAPDRFRVDGIWGKKRSARIFRARRDHAFDPRRFHGLWAPLNGRFGEAPPAADLLIYHLRMLTPERRRLRRERYERLDPARAFQAIGYDYLTDETGLELEALPAGREYRPLGR